jgi:hypothetical protein
MTVVEHQFSELLRHPNEVTKDLDIGDVLLRRRDEPDLRLTRADREAEREAAFIALARALRNLVTKSSPSVIDTLVEDAFPWLQFLPAADRRALFDEFTRVVVAAAQLDAFGQVAQLIHEWQATAQVHADPRLARRLQRSIQAAGQPVPAPVSS